MAKGGARPGAGRPKKPRPDIATAVRNEIEAGAPVLRHEPVIVGHGITPLDYMLAVVRDPEASTERRDRMAMAAAPYIHPKAEATGKKASAAQMAATAEKGTHWDALLN